MSRPKLRKDVALILLGAILAVTSFVINWTISAAIDRRLNEIDERLQDIDRYLTFSKASVLEAFELSSSSRVEIAVSQLMYIQFLEKDPEEAVINAYNGLVGNAINRQASAVSALHAAVTGKTMDGAAAEKLIELAGAQDQSQASLELAALFNNKLQLYQGVAKEKVLFAHYQKPAEIETQHRWQHRSIGSIARYPHYPRQGYCRSQKTGS